ncbi:MAG: type I secretion C-terminal target domain-containing protein, partial [Cyanobacteria bacterium P01_F01_bin.150]
SITWQTGQTGTSRPDIDFSGGNKGKTSTGNDQGERIIGTPRNDVLKGGQGNDRIIAGFGKEWFGRDRLFGGGGNDVLKAGAGRDFLDGGAGRDRLFGGKNKDELTGGRGNDRLVGGSGSDILNGGVGDDIIIGGPGKDTIVFTALNEGIDTVKGFNPNQDLIDLSEIFKADIYAADNSFAQYINYVQLEQVGNATYVKVDADGSGTEFTTLAKLKGVQTDAISSRHFVME